MRLIKKDLHVGEKLQNEGDVQYFSGFSIFRRERIAFLRRGEDGEKPRFPSFTSTKISPSNAKLEKTAVKIQNG